MINHILVATDFSTRSDRALRRATLLARQLGAGLSLAHVVDDDQPAHLVRAHANSSQSLLEEAARTIEKFDGIAAAVKVVRNDASAGILEAADEAEADLIVLGAHRRQLRDIFVGTTAERTVATTRCPVLIAAGVPTGPYAVTLVALEMDEPSSSVARHVQEMGMLSAGQVVAMHAFDAPARGMMQRAMSDRGAIDEYVADEGLRASEDFRRFLAGTGLPANRHRLLPVNGSPARTILECASAENAALIVVGTSQRSGIERLILGSVAKDVVGHADRDVLVVPT
jgi:nucleotide-binding universal stress UspA family protein